MKSLPHIIQVPFYQIKNARTLWSFHFDLNMHLFQDVKQYYKEYKEMKVKEKEEAEALAEQEMQQSKTMMWL